MYGKDECNIGNRDSLLLFHLFMGMYSWSETLGKKNHHSLKFLKLIFLVPLLSLHVLEGVVLSATLLCTLRSHFSTRLFSLLHIPSLHIYLSKSEPVVHLLRIRVKKRDATNPTTRLCVRCFCKLSAI